MRKSGAIFLVFAIIATISLIAWAGVRIVEWISFDRNCEAYIIRAADANTVEMAKDNLQKAIEYAEENNLTEGTVYIVKFLKDPRNDVGFWYKNMKDAYMELDTLPEDATALEKTNVLMKLRESLLDGEPSGITVYPNNIAYFWWGLLSLIFTWIFWELYDKWG